jgi:hypothetical protein
MREHGPRQFLELCLSMYVFNTVWMDVQDSLHTQPAEPLFIKSMRNVERSCESAVRSVVEKWHCEGKLETLATTKALGNDLLTSIETRRLPHSLSHPFSKS